MDNHECFSFMFRKFTKVCLPDIAVYWSSFLKLIVVLQKLIVTDLVKESPYFMQPKG